MADFEAGDMLSGPLFAVQETVFEEGCLQGEGCDIVSSMNFTRHEPTKGLASGEVCPAILICHGLREATQEERDLLHIFGRDNGQVCDFEARFVRPDQAF
ncbi:MAG TPA: hypothetical protein VFB59_04805 [Candidatus Saccharimonadales bacterium]|nr:hypothetical protein [Candidatus Saccharimonadales bacterium]